MEDFSFSEGEPTCNPENIKNEDVYKAFSSNKKLYDYNLRSIQQLIDAIENVTLSQLKHKTGCQSISVIHLPNLFFDRGFMMEQDYGITIEQFPWMVIDTPNGKKMFSKLTDAEKSELPLHARYREGSLQGAFSVSPSPTNSLIINDTVVLSDPQNTGYLEYIQAEYSKIQIKVRPIPSLEKHYTTHGNVHCATNAIRIGVVAQVRSRNPEFPFYLEYLV